MKPVVYFSYSMTKCGSTLAFHLASAALELAGYPQPRFKLDAIDADRKINFVQNIDDDQAAEMVALVEKLGYPIVLKSHNRPNPAVVTLIQNGTAMAHAAYRDPRDMALSMMDHGAKARAKGHSPFSEILTIDDALVGIRNQCDSLTAWLRLPGTLPICFDDIAENTAETAQRIMDQMEITGDPEQVAHVALNNRFIQFNKGKKQRYLTDMDETKADEIAKEFEPMLRIFIAERENLTNIGGIHLPPPHQLRITASEQAEH